MRPRGVRDATGCEADVLVCSHVNDVFTSLQRRENGRQYGRETFEYRTLGGIAEADPHDGRTARLKRSQGDEILVFRDERRADHRRMLPDIAIGCAQQTDIRDMSGLMAERG